MLVTRLDMYGCSLTLKSDAMLVCIAPLDKAYSGTLLTKNHVGWDSQDWSELSSHVQPHIQVKS